MFDKFSAQQFNKNCSPQVAGWNLQFRVLGKNYKTDSYGSCNQSFCNAKMRQLKRDMLLNCKFHFYYISWSAILTKKHQTIFSQKSPNLPIEVLVFSEPCQFLPARAFLFNELTGYWKGDDNHEGAEDSWLSQGENVTLG